MMKVRDGINKTWYQDYLGKPWQANPEPPLSYNCGELVRSVYRDVLNIESAVIPISDANSALQCARAMQPTIFDLFPLAEGAEPREFDVCFMGRKTLMGHCGLAVETDEGLKVLHCPESACGVTINSLLELRFSGFPFIRWFRHKDL